MILVTIGWASNSLVSKQARTMRYVIIELILVIVFYIRFLSIDLVANNIACYNSIRREVSDTRADSSKRHWCIKLQ